MAEREPVVLNGRYELHSRIARGGMAEVFLARDELLNRAVAVKVLFPEFAADPAFVERFRREAQSAANLTHANVVGVYDWGAYEGTYFIVMEYVRGRSLADILRAETTLHPDRAADIAIDIAAALYFAHRNGVVHRDIKPANVLISPRGEVKVADFGIARAIGGAKSEDLTQTGSVMGTATYFSPEQAQGHSVDPRSDLYSLGVVLYEMLVGRPPFTGDTPVAIAYQHVQASPARPRELNGSIPRELEAITLKLLAKNPVNRYATAEELRADLRRFREGQPIEAEPVMAPPVAAAVGHGGARAEVFEGAGAGATTAMPRTEMVRTNPGRSPVRPEAYEDAVYEPPRRNGLFIVMLIALLVALGTLLFMFARAFSDTSGNEPTGTGQVTVPNVIDMDRETAELTLRERGLVPDPVFQENDTKPDNVVFSQSPPADSTLREGDTVIIKISQSDTRKPVPNVKTRSEESAREELRRAGFTNVELKLQEVSDPLQRNLVLDQVPAPGVEIGLDEEIILFVGKAPDDILLPDVFGKSFEDVRAALIGKGIDIENIQRTDVPSSEVDAGKVISTEPAGKAQADEIVKVLVSSGPERVSVPSVVGKSESEAIAALEGARLVVSVKTDRLDTGDSRVGLVLKQKPDGQERVEAGSSVEITVGANPDGSTVPTTASPPTTVPPTSSTSSTTTSTTQAGGA